MDPVSGMDARRLATELDAVRREARRRLARAAEQGVSLQVKIGRVTDLDGSGSVPTDGDGRVYEFEFVTATFTETVGVQAITPTLRTDTPYYAMSADDEDLGIVVDDLIVVVNISGRWWILERYQTGTTTTTTTTTPAPCAGDCLWDWDNTAKEWTLDSDDCDAGCDCAPPRYCGSLACETTRTNCSHGGTPAPLNCPNDSTTTTCGPTTTTTIPPVCTTCSWAWHESSWRIVENNCIPGICVCPEPPSAGTECDDSTSMPCLNTSTTFIPCAGDCHWRWDPGLGEWYNIDNDCEAGAGVPCECQPPSFDGTDCNSRATTYCLSTTTTPPPGVTTTTTVAPCGGSTTTSTTPVPSTCDGKCRWEWNGSGWVPVSTQCAAECGCVQVDYDGTASCETAETPCNDEPTTTTAVPTTTTTTACFECPNTLGHLGFRPQCRWQCDGGTGTWDLITNNCCPECDCAPDSCDGCIEPALMPECDADHDGSLLSAACWDDLCGGCKFECLPTAVWFTTWIQCAEGCECDPPSEPCTPGSVASRHCIPTPTTTTTTTAAPTTTTTAGGG